MFSKASAARKGPTLKAESASLASFSFDRPRTHVLVLNASGKSEQCAYIIMPCSEAAPASACKPLRALCRCCLSCTPASSATAL